MRRALFIAAYDVRAPRRLVKALAVVKGYASGGQKSAYECWLSHTERQALLGEIADVLDLTVDSFALIPLETRTPVATLGVALVPSDPDFYYFG
jgi:CRISPR-associated protein Cas2